MSWFELFGKIGQHGLHEVRPEDDAHKLLVLYAGQDGEPATEHEVECVTDLGFYALRDGILAHVIRSWFCGEAGEIALVDDGAAEVTLSENTDHLVILVHEHEGGELVDVHFVDGILHRGPLGQRWNVGVQDFAQRHVLLF